MGDSIRNWAGNLTYGAQRVVSPDSIEELQEIVASSSQVKALGTRHSFSKVADTEGVLVSTTRLNRVLDLEHRTGQVWVEGGTSYGELSRVIDREGFALPNMASLPHISVAGACATATHGSGEENPCLAGSVAEVEIVRADGEVATLRRGDLDFSGAVVGLGALGILTRIKLDLVPARPMCQYVFEALPLETAIAHFDEIQTMAYSVSLFTRWQNSTIDQVWLKYWGERPGQPNLYGARAADGDRHPIPEASAIHCTPQMGEAGPWFERLPHFRMDFTPSNGEELQSEYLIPRRYAREALRTVNTLGPRLAPYLHISEVRTVASDDFWMSPFYLEPSVAIHFTWRKDWTGVSQLLPILEDELEPYHARPHWGKLFSMRPSTLRRRYPKFEEFESLATKFDPNRKFLNDYLRFGLGMYEGKT